MRLPFCIKSMPNNMVKRNLKKLKKRNKAYKKMKEILDNSIFLILDLEENIDFGYDDIDEVKKIYYESFLKLLYPIDSNLKDTKIEYWNMHTYSNKTIAPEKIKVLKADDNYKANEILIKLIEKDIKHIKDNYEFLYEYYLYIMKFNL